MIGSFLELVQLVLVAAFPHSINNSGLHAEGASLLTHCNTALVRMLTSFPEQARLIYFAPNNPSKWWAV